MRELTAPIALALDTGNFLGENKVQYRATVEPDWLLNEVGDASLLGSWPREKAPIRWFQRADNSQEMVEIPNVLSVDIDRDISQQAATCNIVIDNVWMDPNEAGSNIVLGTPGYFTPTRGATLEANARWGDTPNAWYGLLDANTLIRTYEGVGGAELDVDDALVAGNLMISGLWLVDDWTATSDGKLTLSCRDAAALLIDQITYIPLVPPGLYPLDYYRWVEEAVAINAGPVSQTTTNPGSPIPPGDKRTVYVDSSVDRWYGANYTLHGHKGTDSVDGDPGTFALSVGNSSPEKIFCTDWWEYDCGEEMNAVYLHPWGGNYTVYISIMENGIWQGDQVVPYDHTPLIGNQPTVVDTGADIPYVIQVGCPWEAAIDIVLPRVYMAQKMRISFRNHTRSPWGPWYYRCGIREVRNKATVGFVAGASTQTVVATPVFFGADYIRNPDDLTTVGYMTVSMFGQVDAFGDARIRPPNGTAGATAALHMSVRMLPDNSGYYVADHEGVVMAFGAAVWYGDPKSDGWQATPNIDGVHDIAVTPTGLGYWVITGRGHLFSYGDATAYTDPVPSGLSGFLSIDSHPGSQGLWALDSNGVVTAYGAATDFGDFTEVALNHDSLGALAQECATCIRSNIAGDGYWVLTNTGRVQAFGAAVDHGQITDNTLHGPFFEAYNKILPGPDGDGYLILRGDGSIFPIGDVDYFGSPTSEARLRRDGNMKDYVDVVRDLLLWSGFHLYNELEDDGTPAVFGNLESTGAYPVDHLPMEMLDKRPPIDIIKELADIVGYVLYVDEEGGFHWHTPNLWNWGNFLLDGSYTSEIHELDERWNLTSAALRVSKQFDRSEIILSTEQPTEALDTTVTTRFVPPNQARLRGMIRPALWVQGALGDEVEQKVMAELIAIQLWLRSRTAQVSGLNHPGVGINDQIRITDRATGETSVHYILSKRTSFNRETGEWLMELTTHWLGDRDEWAISLDGSTTTVDGAQQKFPLSQSTLAILRERGIVVEQESRYQTLTAHATGTPSEDDGAAT